MKVQFYDISCSEEHLTYAVICARYGDQWIYAKHKDRETWEIPGGHIEKGETADQAAARELEEETGAICYSIFPVCDYSVEANSEKGFGRLFYASVTEYSPHLNYEIREIMLSETLPEKLTYKEIQPILFEKILEYLKSKDNGKQESYEL